MNTHNVGSARYRTIRPPTVGAGAPPGLPSIELFDRVVKDTMGRVAAGLGATVEAQSVAELAGDAVRHAFGCTCAVFYLDVTCPVHVVYPASAPVPAAGCPVCFAPAGFHDDGRHAEVRAVISADLTRPSDRARRREGDGVW